MSIVVVVSVGCLFVIVLVLCVLVGALMRFSGNVGRVIDLVIPDRVSVGDSVAGLVAALADGRVTSVAELACERGAIVCFLDTACNSCRNVASLIGKTQGLLTQSVVVGVSGDYEGFLELRRQLREVPMFFVSGRGGRTLSRAMGIQGTPTMIITTADAIVEEVAEREEVTRFFSAMMPAEMIDDDSRAA